MSKRLIIKINLLLTVTVVIYISALTITSWAYSIVNGESKCTACHTDFDNGTGWHFSHKLKTTCTNCHESGAGTGNIPIESCTFCHPSSEWDGKAINHDEAGGCSDCHDTEIPPIDDDCPAEAALGVENTKIKTLKTFRDDVLSKTVSGKIVIKLYYTTAPMLTRAVKSTPAFKWITVTVIETVLPAIENILNKESND